MCMMRLVCGVSRSSTYFNTISVSSSSVFPSHGSRSSATLSAFCEGSILSLRCEMMFRQRFRTQVRRNVRNDSSRSSMPPSQRCAKTSCTASFASSSSPSRIWAARYILPYSERKSLSNCCSLICIFCWISFYLFAFALLKQTNSFAQII